MNCRALAAAVVALLALPAAGHPLGNNTVNRQAALTVERERVTIRYLLDYAELPTLIEAGYADADGDGATTQTEWSAWAAARATEVAAALEVSVDGRALPLAAKVASSERLPGEAGLEILRLALMLEAWLPAGATSLQLDYRDGHQPARAGWKEIWISPGKGAKLAASSAPGFDRSRGLTDFGGAGEVTPQELVASARVEISPAIQRRTVANGAGAKVLSPLETSSDEARTAAAGEAAGPRPVAPDDSRTGLLAMFRLGAHHIAFGWDHLVFLVGLLLLSPRLLDVAKVVTAFTLAHSFTLGIAAAGLVRPPGAIIEPAIAATIVYVGVVALLRRSRGHGHWLALGFGLVHGFGFAGALAETLSAEVSGAWLARLAAFNLGIEAMQLAMVATLLPVLRLAAKGSWAAIAQRTAAATVAALGVSWLVSRAWAGLV